MPVKFVVNVPFGLYLFVMLVAFAVAMKLALIMLGLLVLYIAWHEPGLFLPPIFLGLCVGYWPVAVPIVGAVLLIFFMHAIYVKRKAKRASLQIEHQNDIKPS